MSKFRSHLNKLAALCTRHKFVIESAIETSQGSRSVYEYGPLGAELRRNLRQLWWRDVVTCKERVHGIELSLFESDILLEFKKDSLINVKPETTKWFENSAYRTKTSSPNFENLIDKLASYVLESNPNDHNKTRDDIRKLIAMNMTQMKTRNGIYTEGLSMLHKFLLSDSQITLPLGQAWNGKYVTMDTDETNFLRNIEEEMLNLQFYCEARSAKHWLNYWRRQRLVWWRNFANVPSNFSSYEVQQKPQVNCVTENQYAFPWGKEQIESIFYWPNSNSFGDCTEMVSQKNAVVFSPHILQASANLDKGFIALLVDAFEEKERASSNGQVSTRNILYFHPSLAPIKVAIVPQDKGKNELSEVSHQLASELRQAGISTSSIQDGSLSDEIYAYYDEIGTPYCITVLDSTLHNGVVALRNRDTTLQEFLHISDVLKTLQTHLKTI